MHFGRSTARSFGRFARSLVRSLPRSLGRSIGKSLAGSRPRSLARSLDRLTARSIARWLDRYIARSLGWTVALKIPPSVASHCVYVLVYVSQILSSSNECALVLTSAIVDVDLALATGQYFISRIDTFLSHVVSECDLSLMCRSF